MGFLAELKNDFEPVFSSLKQEFGLVSKKKETTKELDIKEVLGYELFESQKKLLKDFEDFLNSKEKYLLILGFRQSGKSDLITFYSVLKFILENQKKKALIMTRTQERYIEFVSAIGSYLSKLGIQGDYAKTRINLKINTKPQPTLKGLTVNGSTKGNHVDLLIIDDPVEPQDEYSKALKKRVFKVFNESANLSKKIVIIGQYVSEDDIYTYAENKIKTIKYWINEAEPELQRILEIEETKKIITQREWGKNYEGVFYQDGTRPFSEIELINAEPYLSEKVIAVIDPSLKGIDYTAMAVGFVRGDKLIITGKMWKENWHTSIDEILDFCKENKADYVYYEDNIVGDALSELVYNKYGLVIRGFRTTQNKTQKILSILPYLSNIAFKQSIEADFLQQCRKWSPESKEHDDAPDAVAMLILNILGVK